MRSTAVRMRDDLALNKEEVPAWVHLDAPATYLKAQDLQGAKYLPDLCDDTAPEYNYNRIELSDGRIFFMSGVDLDFGESDH